MIAAYSILQPALEKISARIAVSEYARRTLVEHLGGDAVVIPNGVDVDFFARAEPEARVAGRHHRLHRPHRRAPQGPAGADEGAAEDPRRAPADPAAGRRPRRRGGGGGSRCRPRCASRVEFLGMVSDEDKARLLRSVDLYVAPNTGGESFGIILVEAMSAGAPVLAADLDAFAQVLDQGAAGELFANEDADALADGGGAAARRPGAPRRAARAGQRPRAALRLVDGRRGHPVRVRDGDGRRGAVAADDATGCARLRARAWACARG